MDKKLKFSYTQTNFNNDDCYGVYESEVISSFDIMMLVDKEWITLTTYQLSEDDYIPLYEYDEGAHIVDTNQTLINEKMASIIEHILKEGTIYPDERPKDEPESEMFFIVNTKNVILKLKANTKIQEVRSKVI